MRIGVREVPVDGWPGRVGWGREQVEVEPAEARGCAAAGVAVRDHEVPTGVLVAAGKRGEQDEVAEGVADGGVVRGAPAQLLVPSLGRVVAGGLEDEQQMVVAALDAVAEVDFEELGRAGEFEDLYGEIGAVGTPVLLVIGLRLAEGKVRVESVCQKGLQLLGGGGCGGAVEGSLGRLRERGFEFTQLLGYGRGDLWVLRGHGLFLEPLAHVGDGLCCRIQRTSIAGGLRGEGECRGEGKQGQSSKEAHRRKLIARECRSVRYPSLAAPDSRLGTRLPSERAQR